MIAQVPEPQMNGIVGEWIDAIEHLIRWIAPRTVGRDRVLQRLAGVRSARRETDRLHHTLCLLS
jgi:hypothetical protein